MKTVITFDDGWKEDYTNTFPIFKKYGIKGTSFLVTNDVGKEGYLSWDEIREMADYGWDFQCHTHNHLMLDKLSEEEIEAEFKLVDNEFMRHSMPIPKYHAYPYGQKNEKVLKVIKKYRKGARGVSNGKGGVYDIPSYAMHRANVFDLVDKAEDLFLHTHDVSDNDRGFGITGKELQEILSYLKSKNYEFLTFTEYMEGKTEQRKIPKIIHQIWMGNDPIPAEYIDSWKTKNPDFQHILWNEKMIRSEGLINERIFNDYEKIPYKGSKMYHGMADVARVEILKRYGGIYIDADTECTNPIGKADFMDSDFFAAYQQDKEHATGEMLVATGVIGAVKDHPILDDYIREIGKAKASVDAWKETGPLLFTKVLKRHKCLLLPAYSFYPESIDGKANSITKNYGFHNWYSHNLNKHKAIIMAAGVGSRWNNYMGVPKTMIPINREPILKRTIRLLRELGVTDITVTVPEEGIYGTLDAKQVVGKTEHEMDRFLNVENAEDALFLYGDVFYTEDAISKIVRNNKSPMFFGRPYDGGPNNINKRGIGTGIMELFAIKFNKELMDIAKELREIEIDGGAGWNVYVCFTEKLKGLPEPVNRELILKRKNCPYMVVIDDETDDFDKPEDFDVWYSNYKAMHKEVSHIAEIPKKRFYFKRHLSYYGKK